MGVDNYYVKVDAKWTQTQDEADFTEHWVNVEEPCSDLNDKMIGFLDCRYYFPSHEAALEFFIKNSVEQKSACSLCSHGKTVSTYDKRLGYDAMTF
jgi:hypothetical protein